MNHIQWEKVLKFSQIEADRLGADRLFTVFLLMTSLKYLSAFHFLTKMDEAFCGVRVDAKATGNKFLGSPDILEMLEKG